MKVLVVGSGAREHAIAWKLSQSPLVDELLVAPGNAGTEAMARNVSVKAEDVPGIVGLAASEGIDFVVVGPEGPLALGLADAIRAKGIPCFGPSKVAAEIESSKAFAKDFMKRHGIPSAAYERFTDFDKALAYAKTRGTAVVVKASGLAAGKGVVVPETPKEVEDALRAFMVDKKLGEAGAEVVIEERLSGPELSLMAFTDGKTVRLMPPSRDHKRLLDGDLGPNTGGMGAFAPVQGIAPALLEEIEAKIMRPAIEGLAKDGRPFSGCLYAGLMLTADGPRVIEFNCRFGDPETEVVLPLLDGDLLPVLYACATGKLDSVQPRWKHGAAACVVIASEGYPDSPKTGRVIAGLGKTPADATVFHAATAKKDGAVVTSGGRVLCVAGSGADLSAAVRSANAAAAAISFEGAQRRSDIAARELTPAAGGSAYASAGVDIDAGNEAVRLMSKAVKSTYTPAVLAGIGSFGGLFDAAELRSMKNPALVASTDGVGTKVKLASMAKSYRSVGMDIVNHCIDDILVQGAKPLFFLDYFASSKLDPTHVAEVVAGMSEACRASGCVLLGGETAEMPGVYAPGEFDIAGTIVGVVERDMILPTLDLVPGDVLVGLASSGLHTNGYSLARKIFEGYDLKAALPELGRPLGEVLLAPHRSYLNALYPVLQKMPGSVKALAHITGGGFPENLPRVLTESVDAVVRMDAWTPPAIYGLMQRIGKVDRLEMYRVFNMGIGMVAVVPKDKADDFRRALDEDSWILGELVPGSGKVRLA